MADRPILFWPALPRSPKRILRRWPLRWQVARNGGDVIALRGPLGAGKTTFARHFIRRFAVQRGAVAEEVPSPTFTLVQQYDFGGDSVWHIDLYRIVASDELWEIGFEEALADGICVIEWPERAGALLPARRLEIGLEHTGDPSLRHLVVEDRTGEPERLKPLFDRLAEMATPQTEPEARRNGGAGPFSPARPGGMREWRRSPPTPPSGVISA